MDRQALRRIIERQRQREGLKSGYCDKCGHFSFKTRAIEVSQQTHWEPAEYEQWCDQCCPDGDRERDEAYERAAARYNGEGKDWR